MCIGTRACFRRGGSGDSDRAMAIGWNKQVFFGCCIVVRKRCVWHMCFDGFALEICCMKSSSCNH